MQKHTRVYLNYFGFKIAEDCICEIPNCGRQLIDIHHIEPRSKFGTKTKDKQDDILNLVGLCREHHEQAHTNILTKEQLWEIHANYCDQNGVR